MPPSKAKPVTLRPSERMGEMVQAIKAEKGLQTNSDVYFYAIGEVFHKLFPVYSTRRGFGGDTLPAEELGRRRVLIKKGEDQAREDIANEERAQICRLTLKGEVIEDIDGKFCVFSTYQFDTPDEQKVPLDMISDDFAAHQNVIPKTK